MLARDDTLDLWLGLGVTVDVAAAPARAVLLRKRIAAAAAAAAADDALRGSWSLDVESGLSSIADNN